MGMPISPYLRDLRQQVGHTLILMPSVAAVVRDPDGRLLLGRRADSGVWELPGGAIDPGEPPARALVREVFEETGLIVKPRRIVAVLGGATEYRHHYPNGDVDEYTVILFTADVVRGELEPHDGETSEARYLTTAELDLVSGRHLKALLEAAPDGVPGALFQWDDAWLDVDKAEPAT
jgi:8-oxo-dGTP pyrophosphatase MutT (NUDIX family)